MSSSLIVADCCIYLAIGLLDIMVLLKLAISGNWEHLWCWRGMWLWWKGVFVSVNRNGKGDSVHKIQQVYNALLFFWITHQIVPQIVLESQISDILETFCKFVAFDWRWWDSRINYIDLYKHKNEWKHCDTRNFAKYAELIMEFAMGMHNYSTIKLISKSK